MKIFTYSEARKLFADVLNYALTERVIIKRQNGDTFVLTKYLKPSSPFDVKGINASISAEEIVSAIRDSREFSKY